MTLHQLAGCARGRATRPIRLLWWLCTLCACIGGAMLMAVYPASIWLLGISAGGSILIWLYQRIERFVQTRRGLVRSTTEETVLIQSSDFLGWITMILGFSLFAAISIWQMSFLHWLTFALLTVMIVNGALVLFRALPSLLNRRDAHACMTVLELADGVHVDIDIEMPSDAKAGDYSCTFEFFEIKANQDERMDGRLVDTVMTQVQWQGEGALSLALHPVEPGILALRLQPNGVGSFSQYSQKVYLLARLRLHGGGRACSFCWD